MPTQDTSQLKEKIIFILKSKGPSLPIHIAKETGLSMLFASAFLSELLAEKRLKLSAMRIGSSPLYFVPGQEIQLENFSNHLKSKEKETFQLLKDKKILRDSEQHPAIRVALRQIKDFAIPFRRNNEIYWRYLGANEEDLKEEKIDEKKVEKEEVKDKSEISEESEIKKEIEIKKGAEKKEGKKPQIRKKISAINPKKKNDKFFNTVKEFLLKKYMEILDIENFGKNDLTLKVNANGQEKLLIAYNKKKITEKDLLKAHKKALELNLKYIILSRGGPAKKTLNLIEAIKNLSEIENLANENL